MKKKFSSSLTLSLAAAVLLGGCASFRPSEDVAEEKRTGIRTMVGPIFALTRARERAESAAKADCFKDGKVYKLVEVMGARKSQIRYRCIARTTATLDGQDVATQ